MNQAAGNYLRSDLDDGSRKGLLPDGFDCLLGSHVSAADAHKRE